MSAMDISNLNIAISNSCNDLKYDELEAKKINFSSTKDIITFFEESNKDFSLLIFENILINELVLSKILSSEHDFSILYSEYYDNVKKFFPLCDYTLGSVRDDFDFGKCMIVNNQKAKQAIKNLSKDISHAGLYDFRLQMSLIGQIKKVSEFYTLYKGDEKDFETSHFAYCDPLNQNYQKEAEKVFTKFLKQTNAYISPINDSIKDFDNIVNSFETRISVIIPVKNRKKTIKDAINSVLSQKTDFKFNVIVVDNFSTDGTTKEIESIKDSRIIHVIPNETTLQIGGCWNLGINNLNCGAFAVQLDSDDVYSNQNVLQKINDTFINEKCGVVIGSYRLTDFELNPLNDFIINHKEYTKENGANNALRVNGFGAPRCFLTPLVRKEQFKNFSYGEDYDICLRLSRQYKVARIFDCIYLCRRWQGNSDANLSAEQITKNNTLKDSFRTSEIKVRKIK